MKKFIFCTILVIFSLILPNNIYSWIDCPYEPNHIFTHKNGIVYICENGACLNILQDVDDEVKDRWLTLALTAHILKKSITVRLENGTTCSGLQDETRTDILGMWLREGY